VRLGLQQLCGCCNCPHIRPTHNRVAAVFTSRPRRNSAGVFDGQSIKATLLSPSGHADAHLLQLCLRVRVCVSVSVSVSVVWLQLWGSYSSIVWSTTHAHARALVKTTPEDFLAQLNDALTLPSTVQYSQVCEL
jgi:hypothetical protein